MTLGGEDALQVQQERCRRFDLRVADFCLRRTAPCRRIFVMKAVALLHPDTPERAVRPFQEICPELRVIAGLYAAEDVSAALIFGGDGTIHRYLPELHRYKIPGLVVPCGSGKDFAKALGIRNVKIAFAAWKHFCRSGDNIRAVDLGVIRTRDKEILFCCVAGGGLDAKSNALANRMPAWLRARGGYVLAALRSLATGQPQEIRVATPEMHLTGPGWLAAVANAGSYGGGLKIAPQASLDDGMLDVCRVAKMNKIKLLCAFPMLFSGTHVRLKEVEYFKAAAVRLESNPALEIYADGEPVGHTPAEFSILPKAIHVIAPV